MTILSTEEQKTSAAKMKWNLNSSVSVQSLYISLYLYSRKACREKSYFHQAKEEKKSRWQLEIFLILSKCDNMSHKSGFTNTTSSYQCRHCYTTPAVIKLSSTEQDPFDCYTLITKWMGTAAGKLWVPLPMETPQWEPQRLMLLSEMAAMRIWSNAREKKVAKVLAKATVLSRVAQPTATLTWKTDIGQEQWIPHLSVVSRTSSVGLLALKT